MKFPNLILLDGETHDSCFEEFIMLPTIRMNRASLLFWGSVIGLVKKWIRSINLKGNFGTLTLRKTWGYQQRVRYGVGFDVISKRFNHSSPKTTMVYLGIEDDEVHDILMNEIG